MREILFRAKRKRWCKFSEYEWWVEGYYVKYQPCASKDEWIYGIIPKYASDLYIVEIDPETLCQFTGLKDKNGKRIWEDDIVLCKKYLDGNFVECHIELGFVEMKYGAYGLHRFKQNAYYRPFKDWLEDYEYEVIGNCFDNPELLKGE